MRNETQVLKNNFLGNLLREFGNFFSNGDYEKDSRMNERIEEMNELTKSAIQTLERAMSPLYKNKNIKIKGNSKGTNIPTINKQQNRKNTNIEKQDREQEI